MTSQSNLFIRYISHTVPILASSPNLICQTKSIDLQLAKSAVDFANCKSRPIADIKRFMKSLLAKAEKMAVEIKLPSTEFES